MLRKINLRVKRALATMLILTFVITLLTGCDNTEFKNQIGEFQAAMNDSRSALESYYMEMNQFERDIYILRREVDGTKSLGLLYGDLATEDAPLKRGKDAMYVNAPFSPDSIQARLDSLKLISLYGKRLAELAGTDAPAVFESNTSNLGSNINNLTTTFTKLSRSGRDKTAFAFVGPIASLTGIVSRLYMEHKRDKALVDSIRKGSGYITEITTQLRIDFKEIINPLRGSGLQDQISALVQYYEAERIKPATTRKDRKAILAEINGVVQTYELFVSADNLDVIQSMEDANQALLKFANSGMKKAGFVQVVARIGEFRDKAQQIAEIVKEIRQIRRDLKDADR